MAKQGLLSKLFGRQNSDCCSISFEEVSKKDTGEKQEKHTEPESRREVNDVKTSKKQKAVDETQ